MQLKNFLKRIPVIFALNSKYKAFKLKQALKRTEEFYSRACKGIIYDGETVRNRVTALLSAKSIKAGNSSRPRIFWLGTSWNQDNSGFLQALNKVGDVTYFVNPDGKYGLESTSVVPDNDALSLMEECLLNQVTRVEREEGKIDLFIGQMLARNLPVSALKKIQSMGIVTVNISMDDRLPGLWNSENGRIIGGAGLASGLDLTLTTSPECCVRYEYHGCPALYWPLASDPQLFYPGSVRDIDVSFIGNNYGARGRIVRALLDQGIKVEAFGDGWDNGSVNAEQSASIFGRSKIILGIGTIGHTEDIFTLKLRDFDATMAGALYLTHRNPDLLEMYREGDSIECYIHESEAVEKIKYYLSNPSEREDVAKKGRDIARTYHTWDIRIATLLKTVGFLPEAQSD